jgi:hypothetical protein
VVGPHRVFHAAVRIVGVRHRYVAVPVSHLRRCGRRGGDALRVRADGALILLVCEASGGLALTVVAISLGSAVVFSRHGLLAWWGVPVVSSC